MKRRDFLKGIGKIAAGISAVIIGSKTAIAKPEVIDEGPENPLTEEMLNQYLNDVRTHIRYKMGTSEMDKKIIDSMIYGRDYIIIK